jgi:hypothetical protein
MYVSGTQSLEHVALRFGRRQELNADSRDIWVPAMLGLWFLCLNSLGVHGLKVMRARDFGKSIGYN